MADKKRPEWMTNISSTVDPEEYLLGRKIDKTFELIEKEKADKAREARIELLSKDKIKLNHDPILDLERRKQQLKMELIQNPVMMKQFRDKLLKSESSSGGSSKAEKSCTSMPGTNHRRWKEKVNVHGAKPEMPAFLQKIKEQIVANEDSERRARSEKRRRDRSSRPERPEDDPTIVKLNDDDLTEAEYKRMKKDLDTQYKISDDHKSHDRNPREELDIDVIIKRDYQSSRSIRDDHRASSSKDKHKSSNSRTSHRERGSSNQESSKAHKSSSKHSKVLSYGSSSDDSD